MNKDLKDALDFANAHIPANFDRNTEIQHPTDLISSERYWHLTYLLLRLNVLPDDVHIMTSRFWSDFV